MLIRNLAIALALLLASHPAYADPELDRLKGLYEAAVQRTIAPLQTAYEKELHKLMERHTKAGNLTAALEVRTEIEQVTGKPMVDPAAKPASTPVGKPKELEDYLVNKTWRTPTGTNFSFEDKGKGSRQFGNDKTDFKWKKKGKNLVEVTGPGLEGAADRKWFFRLTDDGEVHYGDNEEATVGKLQPSPQ